MTPYIVLYLGLTAIVFVFAYWQYDREDRFQRKIQRDLSDIQLEMRKLQIRFDFYPDQPVDLKNFNLISGTLAEFRCEVDKKLDKMKNRLLDVSADNKKVELELEKVQEHCVRLRESLIETRNEVSLKKPVIEFPKGAIQIEVYTPKKNLGRTGKKK